MRFRPTPLLVTVLVIIAVGTALAAGRTEATPSATTTAVDVGATLRKGTSRVLYAPRDLVGTIGRFRVTCPRSGTGATSYSVARSGATTLTAMSGRGASRGAELNPGSPPLPGGSAPGGVETWSLRMGRKPNTVRLDVELAVVQRPEAPGYCEFWMHGTHTLIRQ